MIFVTTGTVSFPFKRLVDEVLKLYKGKKETVIIQSGVYKIKPPSKNIRVKPYFSFEKTIDLYKKADLIISACGETTVYCILQHYKNVPILVPRLKKYKEHVDNQQLMQGQYLSKNRLAFVVNDVSRLKGEIDKVRERNFRKKVQAFHHPKTLNKLISKLNLLTIY